MFFSVAALLAAAAAVASAQSNGTNHQVIVGGSAGHVYTPNTINAAIGDTITFEFQVENHTVSQSSFADPCTLLTNSTTGQQGFDSGFVPVSNTSTTFPAWTIQVQTSEPIWFYCRQTGHCEGGMVGAVNAPSTGNTFQAFQSAAIALNSTLSSSNGTTTTSGSGSTSDPSTSTPTSGAGRVASSAGLALAGVAASVFLFA